ncbi:MarR family transcriptional regulator [Geodermatophilus sp. DSM 44513]|uniref:MarR family winged helix-turn-helix transcriptional regulator n=1 Tax=Geodermatophilus sp. DSM 44513 TaxID=1528104 RepID=UPI001286E72C|nr:MarR family transcriptional regulator [Geodermatophilus sp. DSM 44513]WNV77803.1 MarR family transcriptional regulator [Geodermatophilus sp. DSM 44513]
MGADRLANLVGVVALAVVDRVREATEEACAAGGAAAAALVHLQANPGESVGGLSAAVGVGGSGGVRLVDRLVEQGLVRRVVGPGGRAVTVRLTEEGARTADRVRVARQEAIGSVLDGLDEAGRQELEELLGALTASVSGRGVQSHRACRLCDRAACRQPPGCPLEKPGTSA